jgi:hypothetical protein
MMKMPTKRQRTAAAKVLRAYAGRALRLADRVTNVQESKRRKFAELEAVADAARSIYGAHDFLVLGGHVRLDEFEAMIVRAEASSNRRSR